MDPSRERIEWLKCSRSFAYFIDNYCWLFNAQLNGWVRFRLLPAQMGVAKDLQANRYLIILKARQLGMTWLCLAFGLWLMLFRSASTVLLFSRRDDEAVDLLDFRLKGMYERLPEWMHVRSILANNEHEFRLSNGSVAMAFPTTGGDSYTANLVLVDEADLLPDLKKLMGSVEPTISAGGRLVLLSRSDKARPTSLFKNMYKAAKRGLSRYKVVFLPWWSRPERDREWYEAQKQDILASDGSVDRLHEQYPATDVEALAPNTLDKRIPPMWLTECDRTAEANEVREGLPALPGLTVYEAPQTERQYVLGADPAEGNPQSDESAAVVVDADTGDEVAVLAGRFEPTTFAGYVDDLGQWYGADGVLVERNNHGHTVLAHFANDGLLTAFYGPDGKPGYLSNAKGKKELYANGTEIIRDEQPGIRDGETYVQLASIEGGTLRAPDGMNDDRADAWMLAQYARRYAVRDITGDVVEGEDVIEGMAEVY